MTRIPSDDPPSAFAPITLQGFKRVRGLRAKWFALGFVVGAIACQIAQRWL